MKEPILSIVIPNYNQAHFLPTALDAILKQSFQDFEVIIVNDGSTDNSLEIIKGYQTLYPKIKLYKHSKNLGSLKAVNFGIQQTRGKYLAFCAADDKILPGFFKKTIEAFEAYPQAGLCVSNYMIFDGKIEQKQEMLKISQNIFLDSEKLVNLFKNTTFWIPGHSTLYKREFVLKYRCFNIFLEHLSDWFLNHKIAINHGVVYIPEVLSALRIRPESYSHSLKADKKKELKILKVLLQTLSKEKNTKIVNGFKQSALLTHLGNYTLFLLLLRVKYWGYIAPFLYKKIKSFFNKIESNF